MNEELENVVEEKEEKGSQLVVASVNELGRARKSNTRIFTTLDLNNDPKKIFNIENNNADFKLNDCEGQSIRVVDAYIKNIETKLDEPEVDENGEIIREYEYKKICLLIDDQGKTYVTASKTFTNQMLRYIEMFGTDSFKKGVEIKICKKVVKNSSNKALGFELL